MRISYAYDTSALQQWGKKNLFQVISWPFETRPHISPCLKNCFCWSNEGGKKTVFTSVFESNDRCRPTETDGAEEDICERQSVSWESGKKEDDLSVTMGVSSRRGSERRRRLLRFSNCLSPGQGSCRPSSRRTPVHSVSLYLCAHLPLPNPTPTPHLCMQCQPTPPPLALCQLLLNQIDCRCVSSVKEDSLLLYAHKPRSMT